MVQIVPSWASGLHHLFFISNYSSGTALLELLVKKKKKNSTDVQKNEYFAIRFQPPAKNAGFELLSEHFVVPSTCLERNETRWSHLAMVVATNLVVKHLIKM